MFQALGAAIANVIATTVNKHLLSKEKMGVVPFGIWLFIFLAFITGLSLPFLGQVNFTEAFSIHYVFIFLTMILIASTWNYFYYTCLEKDTLAEFQLVSIVQPLLSIFLSMLVFSDERNYHVLIATIVAGIALVYSHLYRWKIENFVVTVPLFIAVVLASIESLYHKELLHVYSPASLYFFRTLLIAIVFIFASPKEIKNVTRKNLFQTFIVALFAVFTMVLTFYGYQLIGIAKTNIILLLYPITTTLISVYLLKERIKKRKIFAFVIIIICIIYAFTSNNF